jgi:hypothetical protein
MTSEVFVYLTLPRETSSVTAGRFELTTDAQGVSVGRFVYGRRYLSRADAVPIDPIELKLEERALLVLARECGLSVSQSRMTQIGDRDALLIKRFDRNHSPKGYRRARMLSALTLLRAEDSYQDRDRWS